MKARMLASCVAVLFGFGSGADAQELTKVDGGALYLTRAGVETHRAEFAFAADCEHVAGILNAAEPLVNWHSIDGDQALEAIRTTDGWASDASDRSMLAFSKLVRECEGLSVLPASTAGLIALTELHRKAPLPGDRYVAVLTGKK